MKKTIGAYLGGFICVFLIVPFFAGCDNEAKKQRAAAAAELREDAKKREAWCKENLKPSTDVYPKLDTLH
jgi:hypothetical protein